MTQSNFQLLYTVCMSVFAFINHMGVIMGMLDSVSMCRAVMSMRYQMCVCMFMAMYQCISDDQDSPCDHYYQRNCELPTTCRGRGFGLKTSLLPATSVAR